MEKEEERAFITLRLEEMLFYAVEDLPAEKHAPAKSSFQLALEYGFKNTAKKIFVQRQDLFALFPLCKVGDDEMVDWLLWWSQESFNTLNYQDLCGTTIFHIAAMHGKTTTLKMLKAAVQVSILIYETFVYFWPRHILIRG